MFSVKQPMLYGSLEEPGCCPDVVQSEENSKKMQALPNCEGTTHWYTQHMQLLPGRKGLLGGSGLVSLIYNRTKVPLNAIRNLEKENHKVV